ncbi:hypothetical protein GGF37_006549, partial [Kickxella alabastrina]
KYTRPLHTSRPDDKSISQTKNKKASAMEESPSAERKVEISENLEEIRDAVLASRSLNVVARLVAVSKYKPASDIVAAYKAGQRHFGENY